ncbi:hypothetical protein [Burkholderia multivorans]|uniref:hypothetical protein n=2 Tax=Burkholderia multivorans TaxID=87883 RepID=UPI0021F1CA0E|nr:hypothetical protein [Burkholderia multivorans]MCA8481029.1 hypothetical protein [Burkholderia multivorans]MCA8481745.1 hypothetical protein [Burkholderia multivorans]
MSDLMLLGILRMPDDSIAGDYAGFMQFVSAARGAADRIEADAKVIAELRAALEAAAAFVQDVSKQKPERPDYWSSCSQCEHNIDRAQDLLEKQAALSQRQEES